MDICSEWMPSEWDSKQLIKNIKIIHKKSTKVHQLMFCHKYIHNIAFSSENVVLSESGEKYVQVKHQLQVKTVQNSSEQKFWWILMCMTTGDEQDIKGIVHPKMKILSSVIHPQVVPNLYECLSSAEHKGRYSEECGKQSSFWANYPFNWWTGVCGLLVGYCDVFISWLNSHSDGTHSLQRIH